MAKGKGEGGNVLWGGFGTMECTTLIDRYSYGQHGWMVTLWQGVKFAAVFKGTILFRTRCFFPSNHVEGGDKLFL